MRMGRLEKLFVNSPVHSRRVSRHAEEMLLRTDAQPGHRYLDVGCGNGAAAIHIARRHGLRVTGVDIDPDQLEAAQRSSGGLDSARFAMLDATRLPFADEVFDVVASNKATHHIPRWESALVEMIRVLKPGGFLIYGDLVFPRLFAAAASRVLTQAGFPTVSAVASCAQRARLALVYRSAAAFHQDLIWRKPAA